MSPPVRVPRQSYKGTPGQAFPIIKEYKCNSELIPLTDTGHPLASSLSLPPRPPTHARTLLCPKKKKKVKDLENPGAWSSCARPSVKAHSRAPRKPLSQRATRSTPVHPANRPAGLSSSSGIGRGMRGKKNFFFLISCAGSGETPDARGLEARVGGDAAKLRPFIPPGAVFPFR